VVGSLVKTMSDASDRRCWRLVHHIPVEGIVSGFLHAHVVGSLISLRPAVGGRLHLFRLPVLYRRIITMSVGATTTTTNALLLLCWGMLCHLCFAHLADALPPLLLLLRRMLCRHGCYLLVVLDGCFAVVGLFWWMLGHPHVVTGSQSAAWWWCTSCRFRCYLLLGLAWRLEWTAPPFL